MEDDSLSYENLYRLYITEKLAILKIARQLRRRNGVIQDKLREYGLLKTITREWLEAEYVTKERDIDDIAQERGLNESSIRHHLRKFGIPIRYKSRGTPRIELLNNRDWLVDQYLTQTRSIRQVADEVPCNVSSVVLALQRFNIPTRRPYGAIRRRHSYRFQFTVAQRRRILERDGNRCQFPNCQGNCGRLEAHHIVPKHRGGTNAIENGITLGRTCHHLTYGREDEYEAIFLTLVQGLLT